MSAEGEGQKKKAKLPLDVEEISILLIGKEEEQNRAIELIHKHLRGAIAYEIRKSALSLSSEELAEAYSDVLTNIIEAAREGRYDPDSSFLPFLFTIARRRAIDKLRKKTTIKKNESELLDEIAYALKDSKVGEAWELVAQKNDGRRLMDVISKSIMRMPPRRRQVAQVMLDQYKYPEVPSIEEIREKIYEATREPITAVAVKRARQEVRKEIRDVLIDAGYMEKDSNE